jgi:hypothetical protein
MMMKNKKQLATKKTSSDLYTILLDAETYLFLYLFAFHLYYWFSKHR